MNQNGNNRNEEEKNKKIENLTPIHGRCVRHKHHHTLVSFVQNDLTGHSRRRFRVLFIPGAKNSLWLIWGSIGQKMLELHRDFNVA